MIGPVAVLECRQGPPVGLRRITESPGKVVEGPQCVQIGGDSGMSGAECPGPKFGASLREREFPAAKSPRE